MHVYDILLDCNKTMCSKEYRLSVASETIMFDDIGEISFVKSPTMYSYTVNLQDGPKFLIEYLYVALYVGYKRL